MARRSLECPQVPLAKGHQLEVVTELDHRNVTRQYDGWENPSQKHLTTVMSVDNEQ